MLRLYKDPIKKLWDDVGCEIYEAFECIVEAHGEYNKAYEIFKSKEGSEMTGDDVEESKFSF